MQSPGRVAERGTNGGFCDFAISEGLTMENPPYSKPIEMQHVEIV